ncbi:MAG: DUF4194 domain-containing protein [Pseudomonadota bacterium]|nr:DUF4194 domain-containing protein [Pseudomonadota bacterium]
MNLSNLIKEQLAAEGLTLDRFRELVVRLFAWGVMLREAESSEQKNYDDVRRIEGLITEYFAVSGFQLVHDLKNECFRLYAPGASVPGLAADELEPVPSLRARLSADFVAAALALRFLFQQGLTEGGGKLADTGDVLIRFDELAATLQTQIKRPLPETAGDRDRLLKDLKRHRIIQYSPSFSLSDEDALIAIRPIILGVISEDTLAAALEAEGPVELQEEANLEAAE